jgi:phage-related protein
MAVGAELYCTMIEYELIKRGAVFEVRAVRQLRAEVAIVIKYLHDLEESERKKLVKEIIRFADHGPHPNREKFRSFKGHANLFEIKASQGRILLFFAGEGIAVLTHGFTKKRNATPQSEIDRALRLRDLYEKTFGEW